MFIVRRMRPVTIHDVLCWRDKCIPVLGVALPLCELNGA